MKRIRPIDASGLMNLLEKELDMNGITDWGKGYMDAIHDAMEHVKFMPTLEQNEIKHGHWKLLDDCSNAGVYCSVCSKKVYKTDYANQKIKSKYCPYCGSKMEVPKHWNLTGSNYMGNSDSHFAYSLFASRKKKR